MAKRWAAGYTAAVSTPPDDDTRRRKLGILRRLTPLVAPYRWRLVFAIVTLIVASGLSLVYPQAARYAIDGGVTKQSSSTLDRVVLLLVVVFLAHAVLVWLRHYSMSWLGERVVADLRVRVFDRLLTLPLAWFHERRTGELVGRLAADVTVIESVVGTDLSIVLRNGVQLIGGMILLFVIDWKLTLLMLAVVPPIVLSTVWFGGRLRRLSRDVQDELAVVSGQVQESVGAIQTVQAFVRERHEAGRYRSGVERAFARTMQMVRWRSSFYASAMAAGYLAVVFIVWLGGHAMIDGRLSSGDLTQFFLYTFMVAASLGEVSGVWSSLQRAAGATERLFAVIDTAPDIRDPDAPVALPAGGGAIAFEHVSFRYAARPDMDVLRDVSFEVRPGEVVALVGPSGAGKSTVLSLLLRFYDVSGGRVTVEGVDVRALPLADLRRAMAMVAQEPVLFAGTLRDNIAYARDDATAADVDRRQIVER